MICLQQHKALPPHIIEWLLAAKKLFTEPDRGFLAQELMMEFTVLRGNIESGTLTDPKVILENVLELDHRMVTLFTTDLQAEWKYKTIYTDLKRDWIYKGRYHVYRDHWVSQLWNGMRCIRTFIHDMIRELLLKNQTTDLANFDAPAYTAQLQASTEILFEMQSDILATVPQHFGFTTSLNSSSHSTEPLLEPYHRKNPALSMSGPYFLMWPLCLAGALDIATEEARAFAINNLKAIAKTMGIQQATVLAEVVASKKAIKVW